MREYGFSLTLIFQYKDRIYDSALIQEKGVSENRTLAYFMLYCRWFDVKLFSFIYIIQRSTATRFCCFVNNFLLKSSLFPRKKNIFAINDVGYLLGFPFSFFFSYTGSLNNFSVSVSKNLSNLKHLSNSYLTNFTPTPMFLKNYTFALVCSFQIDKCWPI